MSEPTVDRFHRLEALFRRASELDPAIRSEFLAVECAEDVELREEVEELLALESTAESQLGAAVDSGLDLLAIASPLPDRLGPYRLVGELGKGGLGTVFLAERDDAQFEMEVAIKVVRPEMRTPDLEHRLRRERQILAGLEHPNIARILDGGTTEAGVVYLVMERVEGEPIHHFCRRGGLSVRRKLELFRKVCDAVHYAHRSLVLHRDIKPSNILVTEDGTPKLLDFGIAKGLAVDRHKVAGADSGGGAETLPGAGLLTPEYASPEQVLGQPLTTASDVYSLGALLYELVTGRRPYALEGLRPSQVEAVVCELVPPPARERAADGGLAPDWGGDLDLILAMALRKEPDRRYASVEQLAGDIDRYLREMPVIARRDSLPYRAVKFVRRNRLGVLVALTVLTILLGAVAVTSHQARVAERERARAEASLELAQEERERAEEVADFLVDLFEINDPGRARGESVTAREVLDQGARRLRWQLRNRPELRTLMLSTIGRVYRQIGLLDASETLIEETLSVRRRDLDADSPELIEALREFGLLRWEQAELNESLALLREALALEGQARGLTPAYAEILQDVALVLSDRGESGRTELERALEIRRREFGDGSAQMADTEDRLAQVAYREGDLARAETLARRALEGRRRSLGDVHPELAASLNNLAAILQAQGQFADADLLSLEALEMRRRLYGDHHGAVIQSLTNHAVSLATQRRFPEAEARFQEALRNALLTYGDDHIMVADIHYNLARLSLMRGDRAAAQREHRRALEIRRERLEPSHPMIAQSLSALAGALSVDEPREAEALYRTAVSLQRQHLDTDDPRRSYPLLGLGLLLCPRSPAAGAPLLEEARTIRSRGFPAGHWLIAVAEAELGSCLGAVDRTRSLELLTGAVASLEAALGEQDPRTSRARGQLAAVGGD
ncbi:MAG: serine/threonine-protein kinase [Acidobacteriota bacterium]